MLLNVDTIYKFEPSKKAEPSSFRGSVVPMLAVTGGNIDLYTSIFPGEPIDIASMVLDTSNLVSGNHKIIGEFMYIAWKVNSGTPKVAVSQSLILKEI